MDPSLYTLAEQITKHELIIALFSIGFIVTLLSSICLPNGERHQKICGALAVFLLALVVNNSMFYFASVFIGGLVIASEDFMLMLACIFRAGKGEIPEIAQKFVDLKKIPKNQFNSPAIENSRNISSKPPYAQIDPKEFTQYPLKHGK